MKKYLLFLLLILGSLIQLFAQRQVSGQVKESEKGEVLPGVSVVLRGTSIGTVTDIDGKFTIAVPEKGESALIFSYIGFVAQTVSVGNQSVIDITLVSDAQLLDRLDRFSLG